MPVMAPATAWGDDEKLTAVRTAVPVPTRANVLSPAGEPRILRSNPMKNARAKPVMTRPMSAASLVMAPVRASAGRCRWSSPALPASASTPPIGHAIPWAGERPDGSCRQLLPENPAEHARYREQKLSTYRDKGALLEQPVA